MGKMSRKWMWMVSALVGLSLVLSACGTGSGGAAQSGGNEGSGGSVSAEDEKADAAAPEESGEDAGGGEKITITYMSRSGNVENVKDKFMMDRLAQFQKENPNIVVEDLSIVELDAYNTKLKASVAAGEAIDIFANYGNNDIAEFVANGVVTDISDVINSEDWTGPTAESMLKAWDYSSKGIDGIYGVPTTLVTNCLFVNTKILDECGFDVPETWEEIEAMIPVLTEKGYIPVALGAKTKGRVGHWHTNLAMKMYGLDYCSQLVAGEEKWTGEKMKNITGKLASFIEEGMFGEFAISDDMSAQLARFMNGEAAMLLEVSGNIAQLENMADKDYVEIVKVPYFEDKPENKDLWFICPADGFSITVPKDSPKYEAVVKLLKYMTSAEMQTAQSEALGGGVYPVEVTANVESGRLMKQYEEIFSENTGGTDELDVYFAMPNTQEVVRNELQTLFAGNTVDAVLEKIQSELDAFEENKK